VRDRSSADVRFLITMLENLTSIPKASAAHVWADFIELLCMRDPDRLISRADVVEHIRASVRDLSEPDPLQGSPIDDDDGEVDAEAEVDDRWSQQVSDWFKHLEYRSGSFEEFYPFEVSADGRSLIARPQLTLKRKVYLFLLMAANLRYVSGHRRRNMLTSSFEVSCLQALRNYLPAGSKAYMFGKHPLNKGRYKGKLWLKINQLGVDLGEKIICEENEFNPRDTGDGGLDLVAWLPFDDGGRGVVSVFAQCGCGDDWVDKQHETSLDVWSKCIRFTAPPIRMTFIPYCFRTATGEWDNGLHVNTVLLDRLRIITLLRGREVTVKQLIGPFFNLVRD
jgi:hypothetical protein